MSSAVRHVERKLDATNVDPNQMIATNSVCHEEKCLFLQRSLVQCAITISKLPARGLLSRCIDVNYEKVFAKI
jgi:hypothetical protein